MIQISRINTSFVAALTSLTLCFAGPGDIPKDQYEVLSSYALPLLLTNKDDSLSACSYDRIHDRSKTSAYDGRVLGKDMDKYDSSVTCAADYFNSFFGSFSDIFYRSYIGKKHSRNEFGFNIDISGFGRFATLLPYKVYCESEGSLVDSTLYNTAKCRVDTIVASYEADIKLRSTSDSFKRANMVKALLEFNTKPISFIDRYDMLTRDYYSSLGSFLDSEFIKDSDLDFNARAILRASKDYEYRKRILERDILAWLSSFDLSIDSIDIKIKTNNLGNELFLSNIYEYETLDPVTEEFSERAPSYRKAFIGSKYTGETYGAIYQLMDSINDNKNLSKDLKSDLNKALLAFIPLVELNSGRKTIEFRLTPNERFNIFGYLAEILRKHSFNARLISDRDTAKVFNSYSISVKK